MGLWMFAVYHLQSRVTSDILYLYLYVFVQVFWEDNLPEVGFWDQSLWIY